MPATPVELNKHASGPSTELVTFDNPAPGRDYTIEIICPEFTSVWNRVDFRLVTHETGSVTTRDIKLAEAINRLAG